MRVLKAVQAAIPHMLATVATLLLAFGLIRPFMYEAFVIPTNGMAPTLLGLHWEAACPRCGQPAYGRPLDAWERFPAEGVKMNCSAERQAVLVTDVSPEVHNGDRILSCKFITPRRWDLITFRYPEDPTVIYVMRLVGLPDEELSIHDGAVWINGEKLDPPDSLNGIHYSPTIEDHGRTWSGPGSKPLKLEPDEYYVLGDFLEQSADSRFWEKGAPGYPPYAVPESYITGVVINIYWPPSRWISFR
ncbi:MAG: signal peptidase I [Pirellulales bacterium]